MPRGNRPSTAACTSLGARNASEIVILTWRMPHCSRAAICSTLTLPATISSSQRRPRAIDATSVARVSARIGRASYGAADWGTMISRRRFDGGFFQGTRRTMRSASSWSLSRPGGVSFSLPVGGSRFAALSSIIKCSACTSTRRRWVRMKSPSGNAEDPSGVHGRLGRRGLRPRPQAPGAQNRRARPVPAAGVTRRNSDTGCLVS